MVFRGGTEGLASGFGSGSDEARPLSEGDQLRSSARGWHGAQLAVLGFIGLCGVLQGDSGAGNPRWLEILAGLMVLAALVLACLATALVASIAWPVRARDDSRLAGGRRRLTLGIGLTYLAVVVLALGATSAWWPRGEPAELARVQTDAGVICGELTASSEDGALTVVVNGQPISVPARSVLSLSPVDSCG